MAEWNSGGLPDMKYVERQKLTYVDYKCSRTVQYFSYKYYYDALVLGSITIAYMTMHDIVFSMSIAGSDECSRARCITFGAAHLSLRRAATCDVRTLLYGPESVCS